MKKVVSLQHVNSSNSKVFTREVFESVVKMEEKGLETEIKYRSDMSSYGTNYSAMIIGRQ